MRADDTSVPPLPQALRRPALFGAVGILNSAIGLTTYAVGVELLKLPYLLALLVSHVASVSFAYPLHRRMVFRVRGTVLRDLFRYEAVTASSLGLNAALLFLLVSELKTARLPAEVVVTGLLGIGSYVAHRDFSFARRVLAQREG